MDDEGTPFGRYRLIELLGRGGMGDVWRAFDTETQRVVAVKVLPANLADDPAFVERFRREALAAAGLNDPHVVPIHHFGEIDGRLYVDMRLINGRDLQSIIAEGALEPARAVTIIEQIAAALHDAHRVGLVHRDVKPSNILVTSNDFAYLIDFGIASAAGETRMTSTGSVIGTWAYMAPERLSSGATDPRSDTYALACVFHECLTGSQPYPGTSIEQQIGGHLGLPTPRPSTLRRGLPVQLDGVIAIGMAKNPDQRYSSPTDMALAARSAVTQPTVFPHPPRAAEQTHSETQTLAIPQNAPRNYYPQAPTPVAPPPPSGGVSHTDATQYRQYGPPTGGSDVPPAGPAWIPQPQAEPPRPSAGGSQADPKRRRMILVGSIAAVIVVIGLVAAFVMTSGGGGGGGGATAQAANTGPLTGTYTLAFGQSIGLSGKPEPGTEPAGSETWKMRSVCGNKGCVATAARSTGSYKHPTSLVFDDINGRWIAVTLDTERCGGEDIEEWHWVYLLPRPDGSMAGEWIDDSVKCYSKRSVTFTRTGDAEISSLPDPASLPARVASPALGLRGFYRSRVTTANGQPKLGDQDFSVDTFCLRAGDRCLSRFVLFDFSDHQLFIFANNAWTENSEEDVPCPAGGTSHVRMTGVFPLPKPAQDPIASISGHGMEDVSGSQCKGGPYDQVFTRVRD